MRYQIAGEWKSEPIMAQSTVESTLQRPHDVILGIRLHLKSQLLRLSSNFKFRNSNSNSVERLALPQWQSPLMSLPWEVRDMIWRYLLGGMILHLWTEKHQSKHLKGSLCRARDPDCRLRCRDWLEKKGTEQWPRIGVVGYLLSCRQM